MFIILKGLEIRIQDFGPRTRILSFELPSLFNFYMKFEYCSTVSTAIKKCIAWKITLDKKGLKFKIIFYKIVLSPIWKVEITSRVSVIWKESATCKTHLYIGNLGLERFTTKRERSFCTSSHRSNRESRKRDWDNNSSSLCLPKSCHEQKQITTGQQVFEVVYDRNFFQM